jgi:rare lipoprotein A (peptidoglycan hydrolase)
MGHWMSPDPGGVNVVHADDPQTWNMYAYVRNNPTTETDPTGLLNPNTASQPGCKGDEASLCLALDFELKPWLAWQHESQPMVMVADPAQQHHHHPKPKPRPKGLPKSGDASIYSDWFEGKKTSNGDTFHQSGNTAALLPKSRWNAVKLGTKVKLTSDDRSVVVEINDRGAGDRDPNSTRILDLSRTAASTLTGQEINDDDDAKQVGLIHLDSIAVVPADTPVGPPAAQPPQ